MAHISDLIAQDIEAYLHQHEHKSLLRFITCGSVDDGKSTLIGRLLYDSKMIFEDQLAALEADSKKVGTQGGELDFALLVDGLAAERPVVERDGTLIMVDDDRMPLRPGEQPVMKKVRFRTLGCYPLTGAIESEADTLPAIIQEMLLTTSSERQGRVIDHDQSASMEKKKQEGYF